MQHLAIITDDSFRMERPRESVQTTENGSFATTGADLETMKPKLTICVPTYNRSIYLRECLDSILHSASGLESQIEIIVSDNASNDDTRNVILEFQKISPWICYYRNEVNIGAERNFWKLGVVANGDYLWIFGDDDVMEKEAIPEVIKRIETGYNLIINNYSVWTKDLSFKKRQNGLNINQDRTFSDPDDLMKVFGLHLGYISSLVVKKDIFFTIPYVEYESYAEYGFSFLYCIYSSIIKHCNAIFITAPIIRNRSGNSGNYDWYKYVVIGSSLIFDALYKEGYSKYAVSSAKKQVLKIFVIPQLFFMNLNNNVNKKNVFWLIFPYYKKNLLFWIKGIPILCIPSFIVRLAKKIVECSRGNRKKG